MELMSTELEFRGLTKKFTKEGKEVYNANFEEVDTNEPLQIYLGTDMQKFSNIAKGDIVTLLLYYNFNYKALKILDVSLSMPFK